MGKGCHFSRYESILGHDRFTIIDVHVFTHFCHQHLDQMHLYNHINSNLNCIKISYTPAPLFFLYFDVSYSLYPEKKTFVEWRKNVKNLWKFQVHKFKYTYYPSCNSKKLVRAKSCLQTDGQSDYNDPSPNFACGINYSTLISLPFVFIIFLWTWCV